jgi:hypothetical protein
MDAVWRFCADLAFEFSLSDRIELVEMKRENQSFPSAARLGVAYDVPGKS